MRINFIQSSSNIIKANQSSKPRRSSYENKRGINQPSFGSVGLFSKKSFNVCFDNLFPQNIHDFNYDGTKAFLLELEAMDAKTCQILHGYDKDRAINALSFALKKLEPSERILNQKYIRKNKIGASSVTLRSNDTPVNVDFTKENSKVFAFIDSLKVGRVNLTDGSDSVYMSAMESFDRDKYKGVGQRLHQLAVEYSLKNNKNGRVTFTVETPSAKLFHYMFGFRQVRPDKKFDEIMQAVIEKRQSIESIPEGILNFELPKPQIEKIIENLIKPKPILF